MAIHNISLLFHSCPEIPVTEVNRTRLMSLLIHETKERLSF